MKTGLKLASSSVIGLAVLGLILFVPAGTLNYWQGWVFIAVFTVATIVPSIYLARTNPAALQRRMRARPTGGNQNRPEIHHHRRVSEPFRDDGVERVTTIGWAGRRCRLGCAWSAMSW